MSSVAAVVTKGEQLLLADRVVRPAALVEAAEGNVKLVGMRIETFTLNVSEVKYQELVLNV